MSVPRGVLSVFRRGFLSRAFGADEAWAASLGRLPAGLAAGPLHAQLERATATPLDVEMLALAAARTASHAPELRDALHRLRRAGPPLPPRAHYACARAFLAARHLPALLDVLDDRLNYGLFLDARTANLLLDRLLRDGDWPGAARVAGFLMLQEDFEGPVASQLALYAAYKFLKEYRIPVVEPVVEAAPTPAAPKSKKKPEEIKIRVAYLRNPFFDDHFDLRDPVLIAGKTLAALAKKENDPLGVNCTLLGWTFYKKYDRSEEIAKTICEQNSLFEETLDILEKTTAETVEGSEDRKSLEALLAVLRVSEKRKFDTEGELKKRIQTAADADEEEHAARHVEELKEWEDARNEELKNQVEQLEEKELIELHESRELALKSIDEKIWFFDNEDAVDLMIEKKDALDAGPEYKMGKSKSKLEIDEKYIPPEVQRRRSS